MTQLHIFFKQGRQEGVLLMTLTAGFHFCGHYGVQGDPILFDRWMCMQAFEFCNEDGPFMGFTVQQEVI